MFCPKCGKEVPGDSSFCPNCGAHLMPEIPETKTEEKNSYLVALLAAGLVTLFLSFIAPVFGFITFIIVIISTVTVYNDAKAIGVGRGFNKEILGETVTWKPLTWSLLVFFFWIIFLPLYLVKRGVLLVGVKMDNEKWLWKKLWDSCIKSKNPLCTEIRDRSAQLQSLGWRYPVCPTDSRIDIMFVGINPRKNIDVKIEYKENDFEEYYEQSKREEFMDDPHFKKFHKPVLEKIEKEGYHPTSFFTEVILCPTDGVRGLGKKAEDIANTCTSKYLKELIESEMPKVIVAEGNLPIMTIRKQFGLTDGEVQVTKDIGKKERICLDHNTLCLIWCPHPNAWISKKKVMEKICDEIVNILKVS